MKSFFRSIFLFFLLVSSFSAAGGKPFSMPGVWRTENAGKSTIFPERPEKTELFSVQNLQFPGGALIFREQERYQFRPSRTFFDASILRIEVLPEGPVKPVKAWIFCKDKDGAWFQSEKEFSLIPGKWNTLSVRLDLPGRELLPQGHTAPWNGISAASIFAAGISVYSDETCKTDFSIRNFQFAGDRFRQDLAFGKWELPSKGRLYEEIRSPFTLSREYFNPFDPDEITVDFEVKLPSGKTKSYPAFYRVPYSREIRFTQEYYAQSSSPHWEFRYLPQEKGEHLFRLNVTDRSGKGKEEKLVSAWKKVLIGDSSGKGPVIVSKRAPRYFEFMNGDFYFPVGINIHTNTDQRSENAFRFGHLPDCGNADYEEYLAKLHDAGMNLMEVWMAAWTYALEWSSSRAGYTGLGRYNMLAAERLDMLIAEARKKKVLINLVLNNHGMLSEICDPEWHDSPFNAKGIFAKANGGFITDPAAFWKDPKAIEYSKKRLRYTCARWGASPDIFAMELWSEVDLVKNGRACHDGGSMISWHKMAAGEIRRQSSAPRLTATHVCGDAGNLLHWRKLTIDPAELDHVCCDAYRDRGIPIDAQILRHKQYLAFLRKPVLITEYGGSSGGADHSFMLGDIHGGIWTALFADHAGTPLLWWHDFIHIHNYYRHYRAFTSFIRELDLREKDLKTGMLALSGKQLFEKEMKQSFAHPACTKTLPSEWKRGLYLISGGDLYAWVYDPETVFSYPNGSRKNGLTIKTEMRAEFPPLSGGNYYFLTYDTLKEEPQQIRLVSVPSGKKFTLSLPDFTTDLALKLLRADKGGGKAK